MAPKNSVNQEHSDKAEQENPDLAKPEQANTEQAKPEPQKPATQNENVKNTVENTGETIAPEAPQALTALAATHRVPAWQQAALTRLMGWEADKLVTDGEFCAALSVLDSRKQGGGRR